MISIKKTDSNHLDFIKLVKDLDIDLEAYYKEETPFYDELNNIELIKYVVIIYDENNTPIGCGGIKEFSAKEMEIKRMFVSPTCRGKGIATVILNELENWSKELKFKECILETLKEKSYAIAFYKKNNYQEIPNYGDYKNAKNSICFAKQLI